MKNKFTSNHLLPASNGQIACPRDRDYDWMSVAEWYRQHEEDKRIAKAGNIDILFIGDSITAGWESIGTHLWQENYQPLNSANFGIGGDHTGNMLWRIRDISTDLLSPQLIVLLAGVNNLEILHESPESVFFAIKKLILEINKKMPNSKILILGILPYGQYPKHTGREKIKKVNVMLKTLGNKTHIYFEDIGDILLKPDKSISPSIMSDFLHPTYLGYCKLHERLFPIINKLLN